MLQAKQTKLIKYCETHSSPHSNLLYELERETYLKTLAPQMLSGQLQGRILSMISQLKQPKTILEIGTFTGYATLCLAEGLVENGEIITIEANPEVAYFIEKYKQKAGLENQIINITGRAEAVIPTLNQTFDLAFIDAGKRDYAHHFDLVIDRMNPGGILLADNVLWSGKVLQTPEQQDADTQLLDAFNKKIQADDRIENILLPIRDGLTVMRKKS
ncbi:MAG: O-methyltransferase [Saprospiraceae bacterium]